MSNININKKDKRQRETIIIPKNIVTYLSIEGEVYDEENYVDENSKPIWSIEEDEVDYEDHSKGYSKHIYVAKRHSDNKFFTATFTMTSDGIWEDTDTITWTEVFQKEVTTYTYE